MRARVPGGVSASARIMSTTSASRPRHRWLRQADERQQFAGGVAEGAVGSASGSSRVRISLSGAVSTSSSAGAQRGEILQLAPEPSHRRRARHRPPPPPSGLVCASSAASRNSRQHAIAGGRFGRQLGERGLGLVVSCPSLKRDRGLECRAGRGGLLGLPPFVAAPAADAATISTTSGDEVDAVAIPQLLELFAADFLVDFVKDVGHELPLPRALAAARSPDGLRA